MKLDSTVDVLEKIAACKPCRALLLETNVDDAAKLNALQISKRVEGRIQQKIDSKTILRYDFATLL